VPNALAAVAGVQLARRGFVVMQPLEVEAAIGAPAPDSPQAAAAAAAKHGIGGAVLFTEIRLWEPDNHYQPRFIIASVGVQLVDVASGRVLWSADHPSRPVGTPGAINFGQAYAIAAETLMEQLLAPLTPQGPPRAGAP
jgi:hypothetical protein